MHLNSREHERQSWQIRHDLAGADVETIYGLTMLGGEVLLDEYRMNGCIQIE